MYVYTYIYIYIYIYIGIHICVCMFIEAEGGAHRSVAGVARLPDARRWSYTPTEQHVTCFGQAIILFSALSLFFACYNPILYSSFLYYNLCRICIVYMVWRRSRPIMQLS